MSRAMEILNQADPLSVEDLRYLRTGEARNDLAQMFGGIAAIAQVRMQVEVIDAMGRLSVAIDKLDDSSTKLSTRQFWVGGVAALAAIAQIALAIVLWHYAH